MTSRHFGGATHATSWDPERYLTYADERGRPFVELVARVGAAAPDTVVDLGCGPGNLTTLLRARWPEAAIRGLDSSPEMIAKARAADPSIDFAVADLRDWSREAEPVDVLVSNATLQWVPGHLDLLPALVGRVGRAAGSPFSCPATSTSPATRSAPSSRPRRRTPTTPAASPSPAATTRPSTSRPSPTSAAASTPGRRRTSTSSPAPTPSSPGSPAPVPARPSRRSPTTCAPGFEEEFKRRLRAAYPERDGGVVLPFRRVFVVVSTGSTDGAGSTDGSGS